MSLTRLLAATAATAGLALTVPATAGAASAAGATDVKPVLDQLCVWRGGTVVWTPYTIARCQSARANRSFVVEQFVCELGTGEFTVVDDPTHPKRANWACISTTPPA
jgi:hypothetical protein